MEKNVEGEVESYYECSNATTRSSNVGRIKVKVPREARAAYLYENKILFVDVGLGLIAQKIEIPRIGWPGTCSIVWTIGIPTFESISSILLLTSILFHVHNTCACPYNIFCYFLCLSLKIKFPFEAMPSLLKEVRHSFSHLLVVIQ